ncbi:MULTISPECIES: enoyl-CoA hydratase/isomerase family protein [Actinomadura]|uniref:Enoyl-CoA hydratase/carnithine racemase n=1 Tax=Actinomadura madurae TaxID=1993 RepID=A0A1I5FGJ9_9ACTN|nr:enoyl-CoA hydratase-related protein [Actinomadura madurae]SFO22753.1 Enoyl-CoA hydratase/carnithine racemase [Actinomadura madurae]SPT60382.1 Probable enoyl-CoA hydratase echA8 [Actinomadura madurae]
MGEGLVYEVAGGVGTVTIDRPAKRNAMSADMWRALPGILDGLAADPDVRVVVLTGAGGNFCAGADISELADIHRSDDSHLATVAERALAAFPKPALAAIEGYCVGGGCQLAAACDLRFAAEGARFGVTPARLGIVYPAAATARLVGLVGPAAAKYLLYSADLIDTAHALRVGLLDEVVPAGGLAARVAAFAATLASRSLLTQQATKDIVDAIVAAGPVEERARRWHAEVAASGEVDEGVAAFLERRAPAFTWTSPAR